MVSRADVTRLRNTTGQVSDEAFALLSDFFGSLNLAKPEAVRDALLEVVPAISDRFGDLSATVAAEWYEDLRSSEVGGKYHASLGATEDVMAVRGSVRWAAGELFSDDPTGALKLLEGALQRYVTYGARSTVARNVQLDPASPRFAHVATSTKPCAFCRVMGSRGWVYRTRQSAALTSEHGQFHDSCGCQIIPSWDAQSAYIAGYDPDADYEMYMRAKEPGDTLGQTVARMKKQNPDLFGA